jgi:hypothetical protein
VRITDEVHVVHEATAGARLGEEPERAMHTKAVHEVGVRGWRVRAHLRILFGAISLTVPLLCWAGERASGELMPLELRNIGRPVRLYSLHAARRHTRPQGVDRHVQHVRHGAARGHMER